MSFVYGICCCQTKTRTIFLCQIWFFVSVTRVSYCFYKDRFLAIWKFLHVCDEESTETDKTDKLYKVRPILNSIVPMFQNNYSLQQDISLDDGMIPSKNRLSIKQYIQSKPVKWGIKAFLLCESATGYIYNVEIYTGRTDGVICTRVRCKWKCCCTTHSLHRRSEPQSFYGSILQLSVTVAVLAWS